MYLADHQLIELCENFKTTWTPGGGPSAGLVLPVANPGPLVEPLEPCAVGPASIDLRVGLRFASPSALQGYICRGHERIRAAIGSLEIDGANQVRPGEIMEVVLEPGQALLCHSSEYVRIPPEYCGRLSVRSTFAREWLDHSAADFVQPGFQGTITYELSNKGPRPFSIRSDMRIMQLAISRMDSTPANPYRGMYHGQQDEIYSRRKQEGA